MTRTLSAGDAAVAAAPATLTPFTLLLGAKVADPSGATVGTVADIMLAAAPGQIVYVALSVGGIAGIGERLFAVPWGRFVVDPVGGALAVDFSAAEFAGRDGFDKDNWPGAADPHLTPL